MAKFYTELDEFAKADPYVIDGLVNRWQMRRWDIVVGTGIASAML